MQPHVILNAVNYHVKLFSSLRYLFPEEAPGTMPL